MKKIYTLFIVAIFSQSFKAQLTLTKAANAPIIGYVESTTSYDSTTAVPKTTGANKSWNFTSLFSIPGVGSQTYITASSTPSAALFPSGNLVGDNSNGYHEYYNSQTSKLEDLGGVDLNNNAKTVFSNPVTWMTWPFTYGSFNTDAFVASATYSSNPIINFSGNMSITGTGTGTVTLPSGAKFTNCLQIIRSYTYVTSGALTATITSQDYEYWTSSYRSPIISISYQTVKEATLTSKSFNVSANAFADVGIEENQLDNPALKIFPNPAKEKINVSLPENAIAQEIELYDATGKLVLSDHHSNSLNTSTLCKGIYTVKVKHKHMQLQKQVIITE